MADNPNANKVIAFGQVLIDLTEDTVSPECLLQGYTAHDASGAAITGTLKKANIDHIAYDYEMGYVDSGTWRYQDSTNNHSDVYPIENGHQYTLKLGSTIGTRFRAAALEQNPIGSLVDIRGIQVINKTNPSAYDQAAFTAAFDGWLIVTKDNASTKGLKSWLFDVTVE